jgi:hypothetical protein
MCKTPAAAEEAKPWKAAVAIELNHTINHIMHSQVGKDLDRVVVEVESFSFFCSPRHHSSYSNVHMSIVS